MDKDDWFIAIVIGVFGFMGLIMIIGLPLLIQRSIDRSEEYRKTHSCPEGLELIFSKNGPICVVKPKAN